MAAANPAAYTPYMTVVCLLLFVGACGKSAQFPLYVWLPDAMAGPTPVSALIHAATMVTAGVYMVARCNVFFRLAPNAMIVVAVVGAFTALFAATIGLAQNDIKKVLAYSTVSQLGYMFLACGVGAFTEGMFHVTTHAFFKACLFLGAGSVIHAMGGEQDIRRMGGLAKKIPRTYWTFFIATLTISGVPFLAAFFSKDAIKAAVFHAEFEAVPWLPRVLYAVALFTAGLTAFYMFRLLSLTFWGKFRGTAEQESHVHESPASMTVPLMVLAFLSIVSGYVGVPIIEHGDRIGEFLKPIRLPIAGLDEKGHHAPLSLELVLMAAAVARRLDRHLPRLVLVHEGRGPRRRRAWPSSGRASTAPSPTSTSWTRPTTRSSSTASRSAAGGSCGKWTPPSSTSSRTAPRPSRRARPGSPRSSTSTSWTASSTAWPARSRDSSASSAAPRPAASRTTRW